MKAFFITEHGAPEILTLSEQPIPELRPDEVLVRNRFIGVNFVDTQHRAGLYYPMTLPFIPGVEAAGIVAAFGPDVTDFKIGDRVASSGHMSGIYAEYTPIPQNRLVRIPDALSLEDAAASLMAGVTAYTLTHEVYPIKSGETILVHAAAGGVGMFLVQMAKQCGASVIGTTSSKQKLKLILESGAEYAFVSSAPDFHESVLKATDQQGVHVVYDGVGGDLLEPSLSLLRARGVLVEYGQSGGRPQPLDITRLSGITGANNRGSLWITWASASDYVRNTDHYRATAKAVFDLLINKAVRVHIDHVYPFAEAAEAHRRLESRAAMGKLLLKVE